MVVSFLTICIETELRQNRCMLVPSDDGIMANWFAFHFLCWEKTNDRVEDEEKSFFCKKNTWNDGNLQVFYAVFIHSGRRTIPHEFAMAYWQSKDSWTSLVGSGAQKIWSDRGKSETFCCLLGKAFHPLFLWVATWSAGGERLQG